MGERQAEFFIFILFSLKQQLRNKINIKVQWKWFQIERKFTTRAWPDHVKYLIICLSSVHSGRLFRWIPPLSYISNCGEWNTSHGTDFFFCKDAGNSLTALSIGSGTSLLLCNWHDGDINLVDYPLNACLSHILMRWTKELSASFTRQLHFPLSLL